MTLISSYSNRFIYNAYRGLSFNRTRLLLFQNMSERIYITFFLSLGCNFKINYLKDNMRHGM